MMAFNILGGARTPIQTPLVLPRTYLPPRKPLFGIHVHPTKFRALSVRAHKPPSAAAIDGGFDYAGRRVTIGDVVNKDALEYLQAFPYDVNQVAALFLFKVSFWASQAASSLAGLPVAVSAFCYCLICYIWTLFQSHPPSCVSGFYMDVIKYVCSGKVVECVLGSIFGEGDPNKGIEKKRWKMIGQYIALNGGVVTAEEIAPYLDPHNTENADDESYMLPVLQIFNGHPKVDQEGNILYHFPSVHCTPLPRRDCSNAYAGRWVYQDIQVDKFLKETEWLTKIRAFSVEEVGSAFEVFLYNLVSSILWGASTMLSDGSVSYRTRVFNSLVKINVIYTVSILVFDLLCSIEKRNDEITKRNEARERRAKALELPDLFLKHKLSSAREMARRASIGNNNIVYKIENEIYEQQDYEIQEWDRRLIMKIQKERLE